MLGNSIRNKWVKRFDQLMLILASVQGWEIVQMHVHYMYSKTCLKRPLKKTTKQCFFQYRVSLNAGQKYCRMLQEEHSAILSTFIKLPSVIKIFVLSILNGRLRQVLLNLSFSRFLFNVDVDGLVTLVHHHPEDEHEILSLKKVLASTLSARVQVRNTEN